MSTSCRHSLQIMTSAYCLLRQAERSIDFSLQYANGHSVEEASASNQELRSYYREDGRDTELDGVIAGLMMGQIHTPDWDEVRNQTRHKLLKWKSDGWLALIRLKSRIFGQGRFGNIEAKFIVACLKDVHDIVSDKRTLPTASLVQLRMDCYLAEGIVLGRCPGIPEIADNIEHFCHSLYIQHFTLDEVLSTLH